MYIKLKENEIPKEIEGDFKLCYVNRLRKEGFDENGDLIPLYDDENIRTELYFTNCDMSDQWGDDWDDAPYDFMAGIPYDKHNENGKYVEHKIIVVRLSLITDNGNGSVYYYSFATDVSQYCSAEMVNAGILAWLSISTDSDEIVPGNKFMVIKGGDSMKEVLNKLNMFICKD